MMNAKITIKEAEDALMAIYFQVAELEERVNENFEWFEEKNILGIAKIALNGFSEQLRHRALKEGVDLLGPE